MTRDEMKAKACEQCKRALPIEAFRKSIASCRKKCRECDNANTREQRRTGQSTGVGNKRRQDITGLRSNKLTAVSFSRVNSSGHAIWLCKCDCGGETLQDASRMRNGAAKSCGCVFGLDGEVNKHDKLEIRFWAQVDKRGHDDCWPWRGFTDTFGYGVVGSSWKTRRASQVAWELGNNAEFPKDLYALHSCDNPVCVNPRHLRPGTTQDNSQDAVRRKRTPTGARNGQAKLNTNQVAEIRLRLASGETQSQIAKSYDVTQSAICSINTGKTWTEAK